MDLSERRKRIYWGLVALATAAYAYSFFVLPGTWTGQLTTLVISIALVGFLINTPVLLSRGSVSLAHFVGLTLGLAYSWTLAATAMLLGTLVGNWVRLHPKLNPGGRSGHAGQLWLAWAFDWAHLGLSLFAGLAAYRALGGPIGVPPLQSGQFSMMAGTVVTFSLVHFGLLLLELLPVGEPKIAYLRKNALYLAAVVVLPPLFATFATAPASSLLDARIYLARASVLGFIAAIFNHLGRTNQRLEQSLREFTTISRVSRAMRTSLDLRSLLETVYLQVAHLLGVKNFYVALYSADTETLSFPIVFRNGAREEWPARPISKRLTDRVIQMRAPLLIPHGALTSLNRMGLEPEEVQPSAWLGVPLLSADRTLGCMAVFSTDPGEAFTEDHLNLLMTIGSQASAGIENAQLYGETQRRAAELRTLTELSALMSASLNPEHVLEQVCAAVIRVVGCDKSAIFLRDPERNELWLARAEGLGSAFMQASLTISADDPERAQTVTTGQPIIVPDLLALGQFPIMQELAREEGIRAFADLPLRAQGDLIGVLSVYFHDVHRFRPSEIELLKTFASQAALAVANARLYAQTDQALARRLAQLSALETIGRELTSTLELGGVFDIILERAMSSTSATSGRVVLGGAEALLTVAARPPRANSSPAADAHRDSAAELDAVRQAIRLGESVYQTASWDGSRAPNRPASELAIPILRKGRSLGAIVLESLLPGAFSGDDIHFVSQLAIQAAIAIENGQLFQSVREGRDRLAAVLNSTRDGVMMIDADGVIALANPPIETLLGLPVDRLIGRPLVDVLHDPEFSAEPNLGLSADETRLRPAELPGEGKDPLAKVTYRLSVPRPRFLDRSGTLVHDDSGQVIGWLMVFRDVTEEKELAQMRESLTNMIVHDLRSPLNAVLGGLGLIDMTLERHAAHDMVKQATDVAGRSCKKLLALVDSLLDISKMETGEMPLNRQPVQMRRLVDEVIADLAPLASDQGVLLVNAVPADLPPLPVDQEKAGRIFTNLVDNALKFSPSGARVLVEAIPNGASAVTFGVADEGPGIPDEYRERVFDRFVQIHNQTGRRKGSGLGLAFCKLAIEAHGGRIWVENRPTGGAVFSFTLPQGEAAERTSSNGRHPPATPGLR